MFLRLTLVALLAVTGVARTHAADMTKTLRIAFAVAENGFDPQAAYDSYSFYVIGGIFDPLYVYDYFARPVRMVPNTAAMYGLSDAAAPLKEPLAPSGAASRLDWASQ